MTTPVPSYLRLHLGDDANAATRHGHSSSDQFWSAFSAATGWRIDHRHKNDNVEVLPAVQMDVMADDPAQSQPPVVKENATELASVARAMSKEIEELESLVRRQEIELASQATVQFSPKRSEAACEAVHLTLQRAIQAMGFDAAAIYMLDDETQYLKTRAVVGLPSERLSSEPRMLRGSRADLEAMVQDAVLMEDLHGIAAETWTPPEPFGAAVCTAIYKGDLPIGTLWLFANEPRQLDASFSAIAQMASSQITLELSSAATVRREERSRHAVEAIADIAAWQYSSLPIGNVLAPGWLVDGMIESPHDWSTGWHMWDVLPDGSLILAMAETLDRRAGGAMIAATARAALTAHSGYQHTPQQMLQRIGDTLWETNTADQLVSLLYARINPETGEGEVASAGEMSGLIAGKYGYRPLTQTGGRPLAAAIDVECYESTFHLAEGETLVTFGQGLQLDGISQEMVGCCMRSAMQTDENPLAVLRREMAGFPNRHERGLLSLSRRRG
ncbi:MAG: SpoIIE family protein phosphatase [Phycisphaera sp. RhM]|nr:SpoIIE family protein phosphatase [Phycisphaera sp. RhM]